MKNNRTHQPFGARRSRAVTMAALAASFATAATLATACSSDGANNGSTSAESSSAAHTLGIDSASADFTADSTGIAALKRFFPEGIPAGMAGDKRGGGDAIVAGKNPQDRLAAARAAVSEGLPLLTPGSTTDADVIHALKDAGIKHVKAYGQDMAGFTAEGLTVEPVGTVESAEAGAPSASESPTEYQSQGVPPASGEQAPVGLTPQGRSDSPEAQKAAQAVQDEAGIIAEAITGTPKTPADATVFVTADTGVAAAVTARAAGANVQLLPVGDPRATAESMKAAKDSQPFLALGADFGPQERFNANLAMVAHGELPGGGGLIFPGRRMIALYGHPSGGALGLMGEQPPAEAVERVNKLVAEYQATSEQKVMPAFEIIATVASDAPGADGDYSNEANPEDLVGYIDAITEAGGYAFLDLQPGRARLLDQAKLYEDLLKRPNVGLALDPEWKIGPDEVPMTNVGHVQAHEVNEVADWLAALVKDNKLPQKGLIVHQFQVQMIRDRETINTNHPELAFILHADGHGVRGDKMATWDVMRKDLDPQFFMAWKNFIDEDKPMFTPAETYQLEPRPWFVSYQ